ncbi:MAG: YihY/virulence factor BrkB family protein [Nocardioidaceae bacterium]
MTSEKRGLVDRAKGAFADLRRKVPVVDHLVAMIQHYGKVQGNVLAGAVTYFGFLSFFPILALAFAVIGYVANVYGGAQDALVDAINSVLPGMIGDGAGQISLDTFSQNAGAVGIIGLLGVLYSGLGWLSGMRKALLVMFAMPPKAKPNFFVGKARDLVVLAVVGLTLIVSVAITGGVRGLSARILEWTGLADTPGVGALLNIVGILLGIAATTLLFMAMFRLLAEPPLPSRALIGGAVLGGIGFEALKELASFLITLTKDSPSFQAFGVALILVVWINYFSRVTMYAAAWAMTTPTEHSERRMDFSEAAVVAADAADARARLPVGVRTMNERFDVGSAVIGALATAVAGLVFWRRP